MPNPNYRHAHVGRMVDRTTGETYDVEVSLETKGATALPCHAIVLIGTRRIRIEMIDGEPWAYVRRESR